MAKQREPLDTVPRFVADRMLGRLARWLRLTGCDVTYGSHLTGRGMLRAARVEGRIVLTRDRSLLRKTPCPPYLFVESDHIADQLRQVTSAFGIDPTARLFRRCVACNGDIREVPRDEILPSVVPDYVYETQVVFQQCIDCGHIYWDGTHPGRVRTALCGMGFSEIDPEKLR